MGLPRVFKRKARKNIYKIGKRIPATNKQGFSHFLHIPADENDEILIPAGATYYSWQRKREPRSYSLTYPEFPRLVSDHVLAVEGFEERKEALDNVDDRDTLADEVDTYKEELEEKLSNMPDQLQDSSVLNERIDEMETLASEIREMEFDEDEEE